MGLLAVALGRSSCFSLAFGDVGDGGFIGNFDFVVPEGRRAGSGDGEFLGFLTIPFVLFCAFQMTFAIITPALITGATADRLKFAGLRRVHRRLAGPRLRARSPTGCSAAAGSPTWVRSTSPVAPSCTSTPVPPPWP